MSQELIALLMFSSMLALLLTGQRIFGVIGFVATAFALLLWGEGASEIGIDGGTGRPDYTFPMPKGHALYMANAPADPPRCRLIVVGGDGGVVRRREEPQQVLVGVVGRADVGVGQHAVHFLGNQRAYLAGALTLLEERPSAPLIVMNGDILTDLDMAELYRSHLASEAIDPAFHVRDVLETLAMEPDVERVILVGPSQLPSHSSRWGTSSKSAAICSKSSTT